MITISFDLNCCLVIDYNDLNAKMLCFSALAQLVEQMTVNHWVAGSSPAGGAKYKKGLRDAQPIALMLKRATFASQVCLNV